MSIAILLISLSGSTTVIEASGRRAAQPLMKVAKNVISPTGKAPIAAQSHLASMAGKALGTSAYLPSNFKQPSFVKVPSVSMAGKPLAVPSYLPSSLRQVPLDFGRMPAPQVHSATQARSVPIGGKPLAAQVPLNLSAMLVPNLSAILAQVPPVKAPSAVQSYQSAKTLQSIVRGKQARTAIKAKKSTALKFQESLKKSIPASNPGPPSLVLAPQPKRRSLANPTISSPTPLSPPVLKQTSIAPTAPISISRQTFTTPVTAQSHSVSILEQPSFLSVSAPKAPSPQASPTPVRRSDSNRSTVTPVTNLTTQATVSSAQQVLAQTGSVLSPIQTFQVSVPSARRSSSAPSSLSSLPSLVPPVLTSTTSSVRKQTLPASEAPAVITPSRQSPQVSILEQPSLFPASPPKAPSPQPLATPVRRSRSTVDSATNLATPSTVTPVQRGEIVAAVKKTQGEKIAKALQPRFRDKQAQKAEQAQILAQEKGIQAVESLQARFRGNKVRTVATAKKAEVQKSITRDNVKGFAEKHVVKQGQAKKMEQTQILSQASPAPSIDQSFQVPTSSARRSPLDSPAFALSKPLSASTRRQVLVDAIPASNAGLPSLVPISRQSSQILSSTASAQNRSAPISGQSLPVLAPPVRRSTLDKPSTPLVTNLATPATVNVVQRDGIIAAAKKDRGKTIPSWSEDFFGTGAKSIGTSMLTAAKNTFSTLYNAPKNMASFIKQKYTQKPQVTKLEFQNFTTRQGDKAMSLFRNKNQNEFAVELSNNRLKEIERLQNSV